METADDIERVLTELAPHVRVWVHRYLGPGADLDDVMQESLIEIALALPRFRGDSSIKTYARTITMRVCSKGIRSRVKHDRHLELVTGPVEARDPERLAMQRESLRRLYRCLDRLSQKRRDAFVLCAVERLPHEEAAKVAGTSVETLRARLKRARSELGRLLRGDPHLCVLLGGAS